MIGMFRMFHWCLDCHIPRGSPRENHVCHDRRRNFEFPVEVRFSHMISHIYIDISESGNTNSQVSKPQAYNVVFFVFFLATHVFFFWWFWSKMNRETSPSGQIQQYLFFYYLLLILWSGLQSWSLWFLLLKTSALQSHMSPDNLHMRPEFPISDWMANLSALMYGKIKHVLKLVD